MAEIIDRAAEAAAKITELQKEREACLNDAKAHDAEAKRLTELAGKARIRATECKREIAEWHAALSTLAVQQRVASAEELANAAKVAAEASAANLAAKEKELADKLKALDEALAQAAASKDEATAKMKSLDEAIAKAGEKKTE